MNAKHAVVITFSFDPSVNVLLFEDRENAIEFIKNDSKSEYDIDVNENKWGDLTEYIVESDGEYAKLINHFPTGDDVTEWRLGDVYDAEEEQS